MTIQWHPMTFQWQSMTFQIHSNIIPKTISSISATWADKNWLYLTCIWLWSWNEVVYMLYIVVSMLSLYCLFYDSFMIFGDSFGALSWTGRILLIPFDLLGVKIRKNHWSPSLQNIFRMLQMIAKLAYTWSSLAPSAISSLWHSLPRLKTAIMRATLSALFHQWEPWSHELWELHGPFGQLPCVAHDFQKVFQLTEYALRNESSDNVKPWSQWVRRFLAIMFLHEALPHLLCVPCWQSRTCDRVVIAAGKVEHADRDRATIGPRMKQFQWQGSLKLPRPIVTHGPECICIASATLKCGHSDGIVWASEWLRIMMKIWWNHDEKRPISSYFHHIFIFIILYFMFQPLIFKGHLAIILLYSCYHLAVRFREGI